jgi:hypothetical protein
LDLEPTGVLTEQRNGGNMPDPEPKLITTMAFIRNWCRFDHRLTLMLLAQCIEEMDADSLTEMYKFCAEWRNATKEHQVELFDDVLNRHNM